MIEEAGDAQTLADIVMVESLDFFNHNDVESARIRLLHKGICVLEIDKVKYEQVLKRYSLKYEREFNEAEILFIIQNHSRMSTYQMGKMLQCARVTVESLCRKLGINDHKITLEI
ncbi:hypothetical protein [Desertivirga xinjiangensis]|uniref:hypothetical protein n=1 Tax=Desertivirga xinjiangensis TaxID=539206 RepID=UPI00210C6920|nr:hypothetical protein [Pedobacter xinjiangensis]